MTEARILELLYALEGKRESLPNGAQFMPEYVETISKNLASYFYKSVKVQNTSVANKRLDLIQVLQKWCVKECSHFDIDENNYRCYLDAITSKKKEDPCIQNFLDELQIEVKNNTDFITEVTQFYNTLEDNNKKRNEQIDEIVKIERQQFIDDQFDFTFTRCIQNNPINSVLNEILEQAPVNMNLNLCELNNDKFVSTQFRESQINAAYGLLNLEKTDSTEQFLMDVLHRLKSYETLTEDEIKFLEYLFVKSDLISAYFCQHLLEEFPFIYEKQIIKLCENWLTLGYYEDLNPLSKKLQDLSTNNAILKSTIIKVIYELFSLSCYNENILDVIKLFQ